MDKFKMTIKISLSSGAVRALTLFFCGLSHILIAQVSLASGTNENEGQLEQPNILLIVADDMGYADLGIHGSSIRTPRIDGLARQGVIFSQFHTAPMCSPTRSMLLSGNNNHVAGIGRQDPGLALKGKAPAYEGYLSERITPLPAVPGETTDLSHQFPEKRLELIVLWQQKRLELGIILPGDL